MAEITIRPLAATDREAWTPLWHGYLTFYKATLPPEIDAITFGRLTGGEEPMGGFLAFQGDKPLGMVNWVLHRTTWSEKPICYLQDLFGAGEELLPRLLADARIQPAGTGALRQGRRQIGFHRLSPAAGLRDPRGAGAPRCTSEGMDAGSFVQPCNRNSDSSAYIRAASAGCFATGRGPFGARIQRPRAAKGAS